VAWALSDPETKPAFYDCHRRPIDDVLLQAERQVFRSRSGLRGFLEDDITGVIATAFTHWDSRAGDPQTPRSRRRVEPGLLHVRWAVRTRDSRDLSKAAVMLSELHPGRPIRG
jgi:hypothetical protein